MCTEVIWNTEKGGVRVCDVISGVHPDTAPFLPFCPEITDKRVRTKINKAVARRAFPLPEKEGKTFLPFLIIT